MRMPKNNRGIHPVVRYGSGNKLWTLDESSGNALCLISGSTATASGSPSTATGPVGRKKTFNGSNMYRYDDAGASATAVQGDWTAGVWVNFTTMPTSNGDYDHIFTYRGDSGSNDATDNCQFSIFVGKTQDDIYGAGGGDYAHHIGMFQEYGAGTNVTRVVQNANFVPKEGQWYYIVWTKTDEDATYCTLRCYVNGELLQTFATVEQATGGSDAEWTIGAAQNAGTAAVGVTGSVCSAFFYSEVLTQEEIQEDFRRGMLMGFHTAVTPKVEIEDSAAAMQNMSDYFGEDWVQGVTYNFSADDSVATVSVDLARELGQLSTAILKTDSALNIPDLNVVTTSDPLITIGRDLYVKWARTPAFVDPDSADYHTLFKGEIDEVDNGGDKTTIKARDDAWALVDTYIEEVNTYGSAGGTAVQTEMQQILEDNDGSNTIYNFTMYTPTAPGWNVLTWEQKREPVMQALKTVAGQIGWDVRYKYRVDTDDFALTFYDPDRLKNHADGIISPHDIKSISKLYLSRQNVRNVVRVVFPSSEAETTSPSDTTVSSDVALDSGEAVGLTSEDKRTPAFVEVKHAASITEFGRRFMEIAEGSSSQIDTFAEATKMAEGACLDLASPEAEYSADLYIAPEIELQDLIAFQPNHWLHTAQQNLAIQSVSHKFGNSEGTSISLRGKPTVGFKRWLQMETRPGMARQPVKSPTQTLVGGTPNQGLLGLDSIDSTTRRGYGGRWTELRNFNFADSSKGTANPPDGWSMAAGAWNTAAEINTTNYKSGGRSLRIYGGSGITNASVQSEIFPITGDTTNAPYKFEIDCYAASANTDVELVVNWYDKDKSGISTSTYSKTITSASTWTKLGKYDIHPPSGATFAKIFLVHAETAAGTNAVDIDRVTFTQSDFVMAGALNTYGTLSPNTSAGSWWAMRYDTPDLDAGSNFNSGNPQAFTAPFDGDYIFSVRPDIRDNLTGTAPTSVSFRATKGSTYTLTSNNYRNTTTTPSILDQSAVYAWPGSGSNQGFEYSGTVYLSAGDNLRIEVWFDTGTTTGITLNGFGAPDYFFRGSRELYDGS